MTVEPFLFFIFVIVVVGGIFWLSAYNLHLLRVLEEVGRVAQTYGVQAAACDDEHGWYDELVAWVAEDGRRSFTVWQTHPQLEPQGDKYPRAAVQIKFEGNRSLLVEAYPTHISESAFQSLAGEYSMRQRSVQAVIRGWVTEAAREALRLWQAINQGQQ